MTNTKTQTRGHCQCCGRQQAVNGTMAHHGYTVEHGYFNGVCHGHNHAPIENDRSVADQVIATVRADAIALRAEADRFASGEIHPKQIESGRSEWQNGRLVPIMLAWDDAPEYKRQEAVKSIEWSKRNRARAADQFANDLQQIADSFNGKPLQVVEVEAKAARIQAGEKREGNNCTLIAEYQDGGRVYYKLNGTGPIRWRGVASWRKMPLIS
jgi:hypothetical protein